MHQEWLNLDSFIVTGLNARTCNKDEMTPEKSTIGALMADYWRNGLAAKFHERLTPGITYAVYTDYASDEHGEYTYLLGECVGSTEQSPFASKSIPASRYLKFTTEAGPMPDIIINAWQAIWQMNTNDFQGTRSYLADFEVYTARHSRCEVCDLTCAYGERYISILDIYPSHLEMRWVYDLRALDSLNAIVDIYIGLTPPL